MYEEDELDETTEACLESIKYLLDKLPKQYMMTVNQERWLAAVKSIGEVVRLVKNDEPDAEIRLDYDELTGTSLCLFILANELGVDDVDDFCKAIQPANTMSVVPRIDGRIEFGLAYDCVREFVDPKRK